MTHFTRSFLLGDGIDLSQFNLNPDVPYTDTGIRFSTIIEGKPATWNLWEKWIKGTKQTGDYPTYTWDARDPNPGVMQTRDYKITDKYKPPVGRDRTESQQLAAEWAKQFVKSPSVPVTSSQSALEQFIRIQTGVPEHEVDYSQTGVPAPNYDPIVPVAPPAPVPSKLPLIIGGVAVLGIVGFLWWKFKR